MRNSLALLSMLVLQITGMTAQVLPRHALMFSADYASNSEVLGTFSNAAKQPSYAPSVTFISKWGADFSLTGYAIGNSDDSLDSFTGEVDLMLGYNWEPVKGLVLYPSYTHFWYSENANSLKSIFKNDFHLDVDYTYKFINLGASAGFYTGTQHTFYAGIHNSYPLDLNRVFGKNDGRKTLRFDADSERAIEFKEFDLSSRHWYAQNALYGTSEEEDFIKFMDGVIAQLEKRYSDIALLRNERFFQIFDFDEGRAFEPDFLMLLKQKTGKIKIYQIFVEPKGNQFKDSEGIYENSKEGWKEKMMLRLDDEAETDLKIENKDFKLVGLPFYNEDLKKEFEKAFKEKLLK